MNVMSIQYLREFEALKGIVFAKWSGSGHLKHARVSIIKLQGKCGHNSAAINKCNSLIDLINKKLEEIEFQKQNR